MTDSKSIATLLEGARGELRIPDRDAELSQEARLEDALKPDVSIVIACRNGAATLPRTFESLVRQRHPGWEAIVIDDGSTDASLDIARAQSRKDARIRVLSQAHSGVSAARNRGIAAASGAWILFLDCDDWLAPRAVRVLLAAARSQPSADVVVGRAVRVLPDGRTRRPAPCDLSEPFAFLSAEGRLAINSVLVRRDLVAAQSGFDPDLKTHEDWDLWQRLARTGARFTEVASDVAFFRPRTDSLSRNVRQTTVDGLKVLRRGHGPDPRVVAPAPEHLSGAPQDGLHTRQLMFLLWSAARDIAVGGDGVGLLALADLRGEADLEPAFLGALMASGMAEVAVCDPAELGRRWAEFEPRLAAVLDALPAEARQPRLKALTLATIRANLHVEAPDAVEVRLDQADPLEDCEADPAQWVLQLNGPEGALGAIAAPALAPLGRTALERTILAQAGRLPLRAAVRALAPWRSSAFWAAAAGRLADPRGLGSTLSARRLKAIARLRLRSAAACGLQATLRERLAGARATAEADCPHTRALHALGKQAQAHAAGLPALAHTLPARAASLRRRGGVETSVPILAYHRVAPDGAEGLARYRVAPDRFAEQIRHLQDEGYHSVTPEELLDALSRSRPLRGRPVMLTFDDGYADFADYAWPILDDFGFDAVLFVVPDKVGRRADWDARYGEPAPLLDWPDIAALAHEGVSIESHSVSHRLLPSLETEDVYREALWSAAAIERVVGRRPIGFCYPFGARDPVVERVAEECGYKLGFTAAPGLCSLGSDPMRLSRLEITDADDAEAFGRKLRRTAAG